MNLTLTPEQRAISETVADTVPQVFPRDELLSCVRNDAFRVHDPARWSQIAGLGWFSLGVDEASGGLGLGLAEEVLVFLQLGRAPAPVELLGTVMATQIATGDLLYEIMTGQRRVGLVVDDYVVGAGAGDLALSVDESGGELVDILEGTVIRCVDETVELVRISDTSRRVRSDDPDLLARLRVLVGAMLVGLAEETTEMASEYSKVRYQFDRPIGTFQAVKHRAAEMAFRAHLARCQVLAASLYVEDRRPSASLEAAAAFLLACDAGWRNAADNVQNHGGIGYTSEHPAGLYVKRAQILRRFALGESRTIETVLIAGDPDYR